MQLIQGIGIYSIKNTKNCKMYIGKTEECFKRRWLHHRCLLRSNTHNNKHLQFSWNKYGEQNFIFDAIHILEINEDINELEKKYINQYDTYKNGYNQTFGGEGALGNRLNKEAKKKIGDKNRENMKGKKHSEETKRRMSLVHMGKIKTEEHRNNLSKSLTGKIVTDSTREKNRIANQGSKQPTSKYTEELIYEVKLKLKNGYMAKDIYAEYGIPTAYVYQIKYNNRWQHVIV